MERMVADFKVGMTLTNAYVHCCCTSQAGHFYPIPFDPIMHVAHSLWVPVNKANMDDLGSFCCSIECWFGLWRGGTTNSPWHEKKEKKIWGWALTHAARHLHQSHEQLFPPRPPQHSMLSGNRNNLDDTVRRVPDFPPSPITWLRCLYLYVYFPGLVKYLQ